MVRAPYIQLSVLGHITNVHLTKFLAMVHTITVKPVLVISELDGGGGTETNIVAKWQL